jgi:N-acetylated-alpha-linked acidic dipeptidase
MQALRVLSAVLALVLAGAAPPFPTLYAYSAASSDREKALEMQLLDIPSAQGALDTATVLAAHPRYAGTPGDHQTAIYLRDQLASFGFSASLETLTARVDMPKKIALTLYPDGRTPQIVSKSQQGHGIFSRHRPRRPRPPRRSRKQSVAAAPSPSPSPGPSAAVAVATPTPTPTPTATPEAQPPVPIDLHEPAIASDPDTAAPAGIPFLAGSADGDLAAPLVYAGFGSENDYALLAAHGIDVKGTIAIVRNGHEFRGIAARRAQAHGVVAVVFYDDPAEDGPARGAAYPFGPYRPATAVRRGTVGEGVTIPVLPISAANAQILIGSLHGPTAPAPWRGGLPVAYPFARGPAVAHLTVSLSRKQMTLWNTIAFLAGTHPEESVVVGAHRDAWLLGATDNGSGIETLIEAARGLGYLAKNGWQPRRTIVIAGWDGEEIGGYGTIAYLKKHGDELRLGGVAYLDAEHTVTGSQFGADVTAAIAGTVAESTHMVDDPLQPGATLFDRWGRYSFVLPPRALDGRADPAPASLFGMGMPSANAGFGGVFGVENTAYDTTAFATTYADPQFELHRAAGQLYGVLAMRLADADVVPYRFGAYVPLMRGAVRTLAASAKAGKVRLDAKGLGTSIARFNAAAKRFDSATAAVATDADADNALEAARVLDVAVYGSDGYAGASLPEVAHAVAGGSQADIDGSIARTRAAIDRATALLAP